jgi:hypothetical protein
MTKRGVVNPSATTALRASMFVSSGLGAAWSRIEARARELGTERSTSAPGPRDKAG